MQGSFAGKGQFNIDDTWRWGFDINRASSSDYVRDFHLTQGLNGDPNILTSQVYVEGFGEGSYARLDSKSVPGPDGRDHRQPVAGRPAAF